MFYGLVDWLFVSYVKKIQPKQSGDRLNIAVKKEKAVQHLSKTVHCVAAQAVEEESQHTKRNSSGTTSSRVDIEKTGYAVEERWCYACGGANYNFRI
ncbi:hypothetical protein PR048_027761 [Dryococelus australis]|uniref:Uncharacterized protein n=1 Tax=Dryococelus australis TaxID=614101 RepID=A0ABQ9GHF1_9NEOP|nr:hypothetical protein PR048_027761 [Dryococelus australis]